MTEFKLNDVNGNPADPLKKTGPDHTKELFEKVSQCCSGFSYDNVVVAAGNLLINAIRQKCVTSREAELTYDELMAKLKAVLMDQHYYPNGQRRSVFAFHQTIAPDLLDLRKGRRHQ